MDVSIPDWDEIQQISHLTGRPFLERLDADLDGVEKALAEAVSGLPEI